MFFHYIRYLHRQYIARGNLYIYGFIDPGLIEGETLPPDEITASMRHMLGRGNKQCYLAPCLKR